MNNKTIINRIEEISLNIQYITATAKMLSTLWDNEHTDTPNRQIIADTFYNFSNQLDDIRSRLDIAIKDLYRERNAKT